MKKASGQESAVLDQPDGIALGSLRCPFGKCSPVTQRESAEPKALFFTDQAQTVEAIIGNFMKHWRVEATVEEGHVHSGIET